MEQIQSSGSAELLEIDTVIMNSAIRGQLMFLLLMIVLNSSDLDSI